jgi:magnesium chelatase subunit D
MERAAAAFTAYRGGFEVLHDDVKRVSQMVLRHRIRDAAPPQSAPGRRNETDREEETSHPREEPHREEKDREEQDRNPLKEFYEAKLPAGGLPRENDQPAEPSGNGPPSSEQMHLPGQMFKVRHIEPDKDRKFREGPGRRGRTRTHRSQGRYVTSFIGPKRDDIALDATLRAAAPCQNGREKVPGGPSVIIMEADIRRKVRERKIGTFILFIVDASGSMGAEGRMSAIKGAILSLLLDAYQKRDTVGLIVFRRNEARVLMPAASSVDKAFQLLSDLPVGGRTPLSDALVKAGTLLQARLRKDRSMRPISVLVTDGKSNVSLGSGPPREEALEIGMKIASAKLGKFSVIDTESSGTVDFGYARRIALALRGDYFKIRDLRASDIIDIVKKI